MHFKSINTCINVLLYTVDKCCYNSNTVFFKLFTHTI